MLALLTPMGLSSCSDASLEGDTSEACDGATYVLDVSTVAVEEPEGTWSEMACPHDGSDLEGFVLIEPTEGAVDVPWRKAYHCTLEYVFWVADMPGEEVTWYGPFDGHPCGGDERE